MSYKLKKKWGQHLLIASGIIKKMTEFIQINSGETIVEIGPGTGNLTKELLKTNLGKLYLIEIDPEMIEILEREIKDERVIILYADATNFDFSSLKEKSLKLVGNLPYNFASLIIENTVFNKDYIPFAFYMIQKEVAERLINGKSWLSIFVQTFYELKYLMSIPSKYFIPQPKVVSAFVKFKRRNYSEVTDLKTYKEFLIRLFSQKRKMLKHKINKTYLQRLNISEKKRVEELELKDFLSLYLSFLNESQK